MIATGWRWDGSAAQEIAPDDAMTTDATLGWVHLEGTGDEIADWLRGNARLDEIVVAALTATETRPRCDPIGDGALVNLRGLAADPADAPDALASIRLFATRGRVISVSRVALAAMTPVVDAMRGGHVTDPGDLVTAFARAITAQLDPEIADLGDSLDDVEVTIDTRDAWRFRRTIDAARRQAIAYRRFVGPEREALARMAALECGWLDTRDRQHLREAADRFARMAEELETLRERAALMHDQLIDLRGEVLETRSLILSVAALIFLPLTFLTGLLGMNVAGIPFADEPWAFGGVVGVCGVLAVLLAVYFRKAHWFRR